MAKRVRLLAGMIGLAALTGCSSFPSVDLPNIGVFGGAAPDATALPPAEIPQYAAGDRFVYDEDGTVRQERVVSVSPDRVVWTSDESGVIWTRDPYIVTPQLNWSADPELGRGRQTIIGSPEQIFPLQQGNIVAYTVRGSSETVPEGWQDEHRCVVAGQETIEVKAGAYTTFRIDCQRRDYLDSLYYSPVVQNVVLRVREFDGRSSRKELVSVALANDRTQGIAATAPISGDLAAAPRPIIVDSPAQSTEPPVDPMAEMQTEMQKRLAGLEMSVRRLETTLGLAPLAMADGAMMAGEKKPDGAMAATDGMEKMTGPWAVHLASYRSQRRAEAGWRTLNGKFKQLAGLTMRTSEFDPGNGRGTYVRLMGQGFPTREAATAYCGPIKAAGQFCQPRGPLP